MRKGKIAIRDYLSKYILACCVDKKELLKSNNKIEYLRRTPQLGKDVLSILDDVRWHVSNKLKQRMYRVDHTINSAATDEEIYLNEYGKYDKFVTRVLAENSVEGTNRIMCVVLLMILCCE